MGSLKRSFERNRAKRETAEAHEQLRGIAKPPVIDGVCACGCVHVPDRGACPQFIAGAHKRCFFCDHSILCHRRKGEAPPKMWNMPVIWDVKFDRFKPNNFRNPYTICHVCKAVAMQCRHCLKAIPIKELIGEYHTGTCPMCGAADALCPGRPAEQTKETNEEKEPDPKTDSKLEGDNLGVAG